MPVLSHTQIQLLWAWVKQTSITDEFTCKYGREFVLDFALFIFGHLPVSTRLKSWVSYVDSQTIALRDEKRCDRLNQSRHVKFSSPLVFVLTRVPGPFLAVAFVIQQHFFGPLHLILRFQVRRGVHVLQVAVQRVGNETQVTLLILLEAHRHHSYRKREGKTEKLLSRTRPKKKATSFY